MGEVPFSHDMEEILCGLVWASDMRALKCSGRNFDFLIEEWEKTWEVMGENFLEGPWISARY